MHVSILTLCNPRCFLIQSVDHHQRFRTLQPGRYFLHLSLNSTCWGVMLMLSSVICNKTCAIMKKGNLTIEYNSSYLSFKMTPMINSYNPTITYESVLTCLKKYLAITCLEYTDICSIHHWCVKVWRIHFTCRNFVQEFSIIH